MKYIIIITLLLIPSIVTAETVCGDYPICQSENSIKDFKTAKMFNDYAKIENLVSSEECVFVEPDIKATVIERNIFPKVMVFIPYKKPLTGWTTMDNLK